MKKQWILGSLFAVSAVALASGDQVRQELEGSGKVIAVRRTFQVSTTACVNNMKEIRNGFSCEVRLLEKNPLGEEMVSRLPDTNPSAAPADPNTGVTSRLWIQSTGYQIEIFGGATHDVRLAALQELAAKNTEVSAIVFMTAPEKKSLIKRLKFWSDSKAAN